MSIAEKDQLLILDYIDGRLSTEQMLGVEIRLGNDPEFASAFESFDAMDQLERQVLQAKSSPAPLRFMRGGRRLGLIAAAGLIALAAGLLMTMDRWGSVENRVAVLSSGKDWIGYNRELELSDDWVDVDPSTNRSGQQGDASQLEYFEHVAPRQEQRFRRALLEDHEPRGAEFFNLVLQPMAACSVIVLVFDAKGEVWDAEGRPFKPAYPGDATWSKETGRIAAEQLVVLPRRNVRWSEDKAALEPFDPGFLVPRGVGQLEVLVAMGDKALDDGLRSSLQAVLDELSLGEPDPQATRSSLMSWLEQGDFAVQVLQVEE